MFTLEIDSLNSDNGSVYPDGIKLKIINSPANLPFQIEIIGSFHLVVDFQKTEIIYYVRNQYNEFFFISNKNLEFSQFAFGETILL